MQGPRHPVLIYYELEPLKGKTKKKKKTVELRNIYYHVERHLRFTIVSWG